MSHLTTYNSKVLVNCKKGLLSKAAADLGLGLDYNIKNIRNTWISESVDAGFIKDGKAISIGLKLIKNGNNTELQVAGDFFATGIRQDTFINQLAQAYKKHDVIAQCKEQGWSINAGDVYVDSKTEEVVIQASRYVA